MDNQPADFNPIRFTPKKGRRINAQEFISVAKVPKLIASVLAVTLLLIATPVGSRITALLDFNKQIDDNAQKLINQGRETFRFATLGDEAFWGGALQAARNWSAEVTRFRLRFQCLASY